MGEDADVRGVAVVGETAAREVGPVGSEPGLQRAARFAFATALLGLDEASRMGHVPCVQAERLDETVPVEPVVVAPARDLVCPGTVAIEAAAKPGGHRPVDPLGGRVEASLGGGCVAQEPRMAPPGRREARPHRVGDGVGEGEAGCRPPADQSGQRAPEEVAAPHQRSSIEREMPSVSTSKAMSSNPGGPKFPRAFRLNPNLSDGMPTRLRSSSALPFASKKLEIA